MSGVNFRVNPGDKIGLVGRNGAGKTTLTRTLSGELQPAEGKITVNGELGFLPQDPRTGDPEQLARHRILDARGLGWLVDINPANVYLAVARDPLLVADPSAAWLAQMGQAYATALAFTAVLVALAVGVVSWLQKKVIFHL